MKRLLLTLFVILLMHSALAEEVSHITVANPNPIIGSFFTSLWGRGTSDFDVKSLIHGYDLIRWDSENGMFTYDPSVVRHITVMENAQGDRSYVFTIADDLVYSDGTRITAWDYAFSMLLQIAPEIEALSGVPEKKDFLIGYDAYMSGQIPYFPGVHVPSDHIIVLTIDHNYLPFFYEMGLLSCSPYPIHVIAPGVIVRDDGYGVYLANMDYTLSEPLFSVELLKSTLQDPDSGYITFPPVVAGPYILTSWDGTKAEFVRNEKYKGNLNGDLPSIETLTYTYVNNREMIEGFKNGTLQVLNKVIYTEPLQEGLQLVSEGRTQVSRYPRTGLSFIAFSCEHEEVRSALVRQAISYCMDKDGIISSYTKNSGERVNGYYGIGQWMYRVLAGLAEPPVDSRASRADWNKLSIDSLKRYDLDVEKARALLEQDGWKLNERGIRQQGDTELSLLLVCPEESNILPSLEEHWFTYLEEVGIHVDTRMMPMKQMVREYYGWEDRTEADMFFLGSNFDILFDPALYFGIMEEDHMSWSYTRLEDEQLYEYTKAMSETEPGHVYEYARKWVAFQERFNEMLPMIPIYGNTYSDFFINGLTQYHVEDTISWANAIIPAKMSKPIK